LEDNSLPIGGITLLTGRSQGQVKRRRFILISICNNLEQISTIRNSKRKISIHPRLTGTDNNQLNITQQHFRGNYTAA